MHSGASPGQQIVERTHMASVEREPIMEIWGRAFSGRALGRRVRGEASWSWKHFSFLDFQPKQQSCLILSIWQSPHASRYLSPVSKNKTNHCQCAVFSEL